MRSWARLLLVALPFAGCDWTFDANAPDLPFVNTEPSTGGLPKLNVNPAGQLSLLTGIANDYWVAFSEDIPMDGGPQHALRAVRLADTTQSELIFSREISVVYRDLWIVSHDPATQADALTHVLIRTLGQGGEGDKFDLPGAKGYLGIGGADNVWFWWQEDKATTAITVSRRDGSFTRQIPLPDKVDPANAPGSMLIFFSSSGNDLFIRDPDGNVVRHSTRTMTDIALGVRPRLIIQDTARRSLLTCGDDGLREVPVDGSPEVVIDAAGCQQGAGLIFWSKYAYYYTVDGELRRAALDASSPPEAVVFPGQRILGFTRDGSLIYSTNSATDYIEGAGDGWFGNWRFMERGLDWSFSRDYTRVRWVEGAAQLGGVGNLTSASLPTDSAPGGSPSTLSRNVRAWEELVDGRLLVLENRAFRGPFNRLVLIDEQKREKRWVASECVDYVRIPGTTDVLVQRWLPVGNDVVRVSLPPVD